MSYMCIYYGPRIAEHPVCTKIENTNELLDNNYVHPKVFNQGMQISENKLVKVYL